MKRKGLKQETLTTRMLRAKRKCEASATLRRMLDWGRSGRWDVVSEYMRETFKCLNRDLQNPAAAFFLDSLGVEVQKDQTLLAGLGQRFCDLCDNHTIQDLVDLMARLETPWARQELKGFIIRRLEKLKDALGRGTQPD